MHVSEYYVRDSSISGRYSLSKRTPSHHYSQSYSRPSLNMRASNISSDIEDGPSNLQDTLIQLEDGNNMNNHNHSNNSNNRNSNNLYLTDDNGSPKKIEREVLSGSGKSSNSLVDGHRTVGQITRTMSKMIKKGVYTSAPPTVNIILDINTNQVTELNASTPEKTEFPTGVVPRMMIRLKSAASVMQSSLMGFGFGLGLTESLPVLETDLSRRLFLLYFYIIIIINVIVIIFILHLPSFICKLVHHVQVY